MKFLAPRVLVLGLALMVSTSFALRAAETKKASVEQPWVSLFNGKNLDGWTIKIAGRPLGENFANTFTVDDGVIKVGYGGYQAFNSQFGHLFTNIAYSHYILRLDYKITGKMMPDAPKYVFLNSGVMIHAQSPQSMRHDQGFPASLEFQFLAGDGSGRRQTGNVCTPGTNIEMGGKLITQHIVESSAPTFLADEWVSIEVEVHGSEEVIYRVNGAEVLRYQRPQLDPADPQAKDLLALGADKYLGFGHIALQAEGQPVWFRNIQLKSLEPR